MASVVRVQQMLRRLAVVAALVAGILWMHPATVDHHDGADQGSIAAHDVQCGDRIDRRGRSSSAWSPAETVKRPLVSPLTAGFTHQTTLETQMQFPRLFRAPSRVLLVGIAGLGLVLAACGDDDDADTTSETTMPAQGADTTMAAVGHNEADVAFATGMIPHHRQAVEMAEMLIANGEDPAVINLAERIKAAQDPEIETMTGWLEEWGEPMPDASMAGHGDEAEIDEMETLLGTG